ncbi:MAG: tetratricopeptide repeat protein [Acidobacteriota bacterium]|nr:tetratricopeptide repeat protein [Acidobacteriota bacterium]
MPTRARFIILLLVAFILPESGLRLNARTIYGAQQNSEGRAAALVAEGADHLAKGDLETAKTLFRQALALNPRDGAAHTYLGAIADHENDLAEAEKHFAAAAQIAPRSASAHNNYGAILLRRGRTAEAAAQFEISVGLDKQGRSALINLAQIYSSSGTVKDLRLARDLFMRASALGSDVELARALVLVNLRLQDPEAARTAYRDYATQMAANTNTEAVAAASRAELGAALFEGKLFEEAIAELNAALTAEPKNVEATLTLARLYLAQKKIPAAGRTLELAVARGVDAAPVYAQLAEVYELSNHIENAIPAMRLAIQRDPRSESYRFRYAMILVDAKTPAAAAIRLQEALKEFPRSARLWFALGVAHNAEQKGAEAVEAFSRALEIDPHFAPALADLGASLEEQGRYSEAIGYYERALAVDEKQYIVHYLLGEALIKQNPEESSRAEEHLTRAAALEPEFAEAYLSLGKIYARKGRLSEAVAEFEHAIKLDPNIAEAHYQLGRAYARLKRTDEAQNELALFKQLSETQKEQAQNERRDIVRRLANVRF